MKVREVKPIDSENLAYWYFRLNGFLTTVNFVVHPDSRCGQETDVDILGVRFPYRAELLKNPMVDEEIFTKVKHKPYIIIAEVKSQTCNLNGPWVQRERMNIHRVLRAIGVFPEASVDRIAKQIYEKGVFENQLAYLSLFCVGNQINQDLKQKYPEVPQITWKNVLEFIYSRFNTYKIQKASHPQWDWTGQRLWKYANSAQEDFISNIIEQLLTQHKRQRPQT
ncbi:MAG: hypothetical protein C4550_01015 [Nitrospiraceae bacterium]|nr:MAG: hypothetical protein C4550_01015 [Nitrospiraceae bacterium]